MAQQAKLATHRPLGTESKLNDRTENSHFSVRIFSNVTGIFRYQEIKRLKLHILKELNTLYISLI